MPVVRAPRRRLHLGPLLITLPILIALVAGVGGLAVGMCTLIAPGDGPLGGLLNRISGVDTRDLPGDARSFDPFAALPAVLEYAGDGAQLVEIEMSLVRADGTMDLKPDYSPKPYTDYTFVREVPRPSDAPPPGAGAANTGPWYETVEIRAYEPGQTRRRVITGGNTNSDVRYKNKGLERSVSSARSGAVETVPFPACAVSDLFAEAIARGAPADAVARLTYDVDGYEFRITGMSIRLDFDHTCAVKD
jgi:hypothetical protein